MFTDCYCLQSEAFSDFLQNWLLLEVLLAHTVTIHRICKWVVTKCDFPSLNWTDLISVELFRLRRITYSKLNALFVLRHQAQQMLLLALMISSFFSLFYFLSSYWRSAKNSQKVLSYSDSPNVICSLVSDMLGYRRLKFWLMVSFCYSHCCSEFITCDWLLFIHVFFFFSALTTVRFLFISVTLAFQVVCQSLSTSWSGFEPQDLDAVFFFKDIGSV